MTNSSRKEGKVLQKIRQVAYIVVTEQCCNAATFLRIIWSEMFYTVEEFSSFSQLQMAQAI